LDPVA
jgi:hypothetical protein